MKNVIFLISCICMIYSSIAVSGGRTSLAVPTRIDTIGVHNGFMIWGEFGNPSGCTEVNSIWVKGDHQQYDKIYSTALAAFMAGKKIAAYAHSCETVGWYTTPDHTFNVLGPSGDLRISN